MRRKMPEPASLLVRIVAWDRLCWALFLVGGCLSFGNDCQPIEIVEAYFHRFFQMRLEVIG
jgi:hypothetical protein